MVLLNDKKYACETCIKGHRSSACKHIDRPLYEIKKKGRPVTQCEHCRELRKTKQVHVKCLCGQDPSGAGGEASNKKGTAKLPAVAAFPRGLPEDLEALAILPAISDGSVDSDHSGETSPSGCRCNKAGPCDCAVPRKAVPRRRLSNHDATRGDKHRSETSLSSTKEPFPPLSSHVIARIAELRPVLPRPARTLSEGPIHDPSLGTPHGHNFRHHSHDNMFFSPYNRAYEQTHIPDFAHERKPTMAAGDGRMLASLASIQQDAMTGISSAVESWQSIGGGPPSSCACGDSCSCPGCSQHNGAAISPGGAYASCTNPTSCTFCLDCTILSFSANTAQPSLDTNSDPQSRELEEWLRQISGSASPTPMGMQPTISPYELVVNNQVHALPNAEGIMRSAVTQADNRYGRCPSCPGGSCSCSAGGRQCEQPNDGFRSRTTFAVSGERGACCDKPEMVSGAAIPHRPPRIPDYMTMTSIRNGPVTNANVRQAENYPEQVNYMNGVEAPSRSSSTSSTSSRLSRTSPISGNNSGMFHNGALAGSASQSRPRNVTVNGYRSYGQPQAPPRTSGHNQYDAYPGFNPTQF